MKTIEKGNNKAGTEYRLVMINNGMFLVYKQCLNYSAHTKGGIRESFRYVAPHQRMSFKESSEYARNGVPEKEARELFNRKLKGKVKA